MSLLNLLTFKMFYSKLNYMRIIQKSHEKWNQKINWFDVKDFRTHAHFFLILYIFHECSYVWVSKNGFCSKNFIFKFHFISMI